MNPAPGRHEKEKNSFVDLTAQASDGYYFLDWTGDVEDTDSPITKIYMGQLPRP